MGLEITGTHRFAVAGVAADDISEPALQIVEIAGQAEDRHHFGGDYDVEAVLAREAVGDAAERGQDRAQSPLFHIDRPPPSNAAGIDAERIAPINVIVDEGAKEIVGGTDGMQGAGEKKVDVLPSPPPGG